MFHVAIFVRVGADIFFTFSDVIEFDAPVCVVGFSSLILGRDENHFTCMANVYCKLSWYWRELGC